MATPGTSSEAPAPAGRPGRVYLIDGSGYIFRAYHALPPLSRSDGTPTGAVAGFCNMLVKLMDEVVVGGDAGHLAVIFDKGRTSFRNDLYPEYKANRPPPPEDLVPQFGLIREATRAFNVACIEIEGFEADDVIATYARIAREAGHEVVIVSSDKDMMQLVGEGVSMLDPIRSRPIGAAEVGEKFGVGPDKVIEVQALAGDSTDNVPGVPGIGVKTAAELINTYGDLETLLARADEIKQPKRRESLKTHAAAARLSHRLVRLRDDVPLSHDLDDLEVRAAEPETLFGFLDTMELKTLAERLRKRGEGETPPAPTAAARAPETAEHTALRSAEALGAWIAHATEAGVIALSVQGSVADPQAAELVGIGLSAGAGAAGYLPLGHVAGGDGDARLDLGGDGSGAPTAASAQVAMETALALLKPLLEDPAVLKVGHNIKYAVRLLARHGIALGPLDDVMVLSFVLDAGVHGHDEGLAERHLGVTPKTYKSVVGTGKSRIGFAEVAVEAAMAYAAEDADLILHLHAYLKPRLVAERLVSVYETLERPLVAVLAEMEGAGVRVDPIILAALSDDFGRRMADFEAEIHDLAGHPFNVGSPKQLGEVLFDEMGLSGGRKGKTGAYGTGADVLEGLAAERHALPARVLEWRQLAKLKSTYTDNLQAEIDAASGRVHTSYAMAGAATGRLASVDPNLMNIPIRTEEGRKIRRAFIAAKDRVLLSADYSQIELRLLAHIADIASLREAFAEGADIHALTASQVFGVPVAGMDAAVRRRAKAINFGIIYGISAFGLARQLGIARGEAQAYIEAYFERYPEIRDYMERTKEFCRDHGYVETIFGRRCHLPGIKDKNPAHRAFSERAAINAPLQGSAADIIKRAMIRIPGALDAAGSAATMLLQVHDELVFEVARAEVEDTAALVKGVMEGAAHLKVPLIVDTGAGPNWDEAH